MKPSTTSLCTLTTFAPAAVLAGRCAYGTCQAGCAKLVVACYCGSGATFGATFGDSATPAVLGCDAAYGICQAACWQAGSAPPC